MGHKSAHFSNDGLPCRPWLPRAARYARWSLTCALSMVGCIGCSAGGDNAIPTPPSPVSVATSTDTSSSAELTATGLATQTSSASNSSTPTPAVPASDLQAARSFTQTQALKGARGDVKSVSWSPDGKTVAAATKDDLWLWNVDTEKEPRVLRGHKGQIWGVAWSPVGTTVASSADDGSVKLWATGSGTQAGELIRWIGNNAMRGGTVLCVAWARDDQSLVAGYADSEVVIWDAKVNKPRITLNGHDSAVISVAWSPDGKLVASGSLDASIILWDAASGKQLRKVVAPTQARDDINGLAWSPDGRTLAAASQDGKVRLWDPETGSLRRELQGHDGWARGVTWSPDGSAIASSGSDQTVRLWDVATGQQVSTLGGYDLPVWSVAWSPNGNRLATGDGSGEVRIGGTP